MKILKFQNRLYIKTLIICLSCLFLLLNNLNAIEPVELHPPIETIEHIRLLTDSVFANEFVIKTNDVGTGSLDAVGEICYYDLSNSVLKLTVTNNPDIPYCFERSIKNCDLITKLNINGYEYNLGKESANFKFDLEYEIELEGYNSSNSPVKKYPKFILKVNSNTNTFIVEEEKIIITDDFDPSPVNYITQIILSEIKLLKYSNINFNSNKIILHLELKINETQKPNYDLYEIATRWLTTGQDYLNLNSNEIDNTNLNSLNDEFIWSKSPNIFESQQSYQECLLIPESFEIQILRLYNQKQEYSNDPKNCYTIVDWNKATSLIVPPLLNSENYYYYLKNYIPTEGTGYYIYRVRPIFKYFSGGHNNPLNWGNWNKVFGLDQLAVNGVFMELSDCSYKNGDIIDINYNGLISGNIPTTMKRNHTALYIKIDEEKNWQHQRIFTDADDKFSQFHESMTYFNNILQPVQTLDRNINDNLVIGQQKIYDQIGRNIINTLPIPIQKNTVDLLLGDPEDNTSLKYRKNLALTDVNSVNSMFRGINETSTTNPFDISLNRGRVNDYYDGNSTYSSGSLINSQYPIPNAEGKAYQHNVFSEDGLNRIEMSSQPGSNFSITNPANPQDNHALEYYYAKATENELLEIFGAEAPNYEYISKEIVVDSKSDKVSFTYKDNQGKVIATAIKTPSGYPSPSTDKYLGESFSNSFTIKEQYENQINSNLDFILNNDISLPSSVNVNFVYSADVKQLKISLCENISNFVKSIEYSNPYKFSSTFFIDGDENGFRFMPDFTFNSGIKKANNHFATPSLLFDYVTPVLSGDENKEFGTLSKTKSHTNLIGKYNHNTTISIKNKEQFSFLNDAIDEYYQYYYFGDNSQYKINKVLDLIQEAKTKIYNEEVDYSLNDFVTELTTNNDYKYNISTPLWSATTNHGTTTLSSNLVHNTNNDDCIEKIEMQLPKCQSCDLSKYPKILDENGNPTNNYDISKYLLDKVFEKYQGQFIFGLKNEEFEQLQGKDSKLPIFDNLCTFTKVYKDDVSFEFPTKTSGSYTEYEKRILNLLFIHNYYPLNMYFQDETLKGRVNFEYSTYDGFNQLIQNLRDFQELSETAGVYYEYSDEKICVALDKFIENFIGSVFVNSPNFTEVKDLDTEKSDNSTKDLEYKPEDKTKTEKLYLNKNINTLENLFTFLGRSMRGYRNDNSLRDLPNDNFINKAHLYFKYWDEGFTKKMIGNDDLGNAFKQTIPSYSKVISGGIELGANGNLQDKFKLFTKDDFTLPTAQLSACEDNTEKNKKKWESFYKEYMSAFISDEQRKMRDAFKSEKNLSKSQKISESQDELDEYIKILNNQNVEWSDRIDELRSAMQLVVDNTNSMCDAKRIVFENAIKEYLAVNEYDVTGVINTGKTYKINQAQFNRLVDILITDCHKYIDQKINEEYVEAIINNDNNNTHSMFVDFYSGSGINEGKRAEYKIAFAKGKFPDIKNIRLQNIVTSAMDFKMGADYSLTSNCSFGAGYSDIFIEKNEHISKLNTLKSTLKTEIANFLEASKVDVSNIHEDYYNNYIEYLNNIDYDYLNNFRILLKNNIDNFLTTISNSENLTSNRLQEKTEFVQYPFFTNQGSNVSTDMYIKSQKGYYNRTNVRNSNIIKKYNIEYQDYFEYDLQTGYSDYYIDYYDFKLSGTPKSLIDFHKEYLFNITPSLFCKDISWRLIEPFSGANLFGGFDITINKKYLETEDIYSVINYTIDNNISNRSQYIYEVSLVYWNNIYRDCPDCKEDVYDEKVESGNYIKNPSVRTLVVNTPIAHISFENDVECSNDFTGSNINPAHQQYVEDCSISYEFIDAPSEEFDFEKEKIKLCTIDFLNQLEHKIMYNILSAKQIQQKKVQETIDDYYRELPNNVKQTLTATYIQDLTYFTLYFYDRAGNLIKTVPPKGVKFARPTGCPSCTTLAAKRSYYIPYTHYTLYQYNTNKALVSSKSADENYTNRFWYNRNGMLRYSQTAKQFEEGKISYNLYDKLGRLIENGEVKFNGINLAANPFPIADIDSRIQKMIYDDSDRHNHINNIENNLYPSVIDLTALNAEYSFRMLTNYSNMTNIPGYPGFRPIQPTRQNLRNRVNNVTRDEDGNLTTKADQVITYYSYDLHGNVEYVVQDLPVSTDGEFRLFANTQYNYDLLTKKVLGVAYNYYESDSYVQSYNYDANNRLKKVTSSRYEELDDREAGYKYYPHGPLQRIELGEDRLQGIDYTYTINGWLKGINHTDLNLYGTSNGMDIKEPGKDGLNVVPQPGQPVNFNSTVGKDAFSMILNYYENDFKNTSNTYFANSNLFSGASNPFPELFDGNIAIWQTNSMSYTGSNPVYNSFDQGFKYDKINRLIYSNTFSGTPALNDLNKTTYTYDANGNISHLDRFDVTGVQFDNMNYGYSSGASNNKLSQITDGVSASNYVGDLEDQPDPNNYTYDASGNMIGDASEGVSNIIWTPDGKIKSMNKNVLLPLPSTTNINYTYDAMGQRIMKSVTTMGQTPNTKQTIYARDANGQVMAIYEREFNPLSDNNPDPRLEFEVEITVGDCSTIIEINSDDYVLNTDENGINITGSMPVGVLCGEFLFQYLMQMGQDIEVDELKNQEITKDFISWFSKNASKIKKLKFADGSWYDVNQGVILKDIHNNDVAATITKIKPKITYGNPSMLPKLAEWHVYGNEQQGRFMTKYPEELTPPTYYGTEVTDDIKDNKFKRQLGKKAYELKDHLGNVRVTFSDIKMPTGSGTQPFEVDLLSKSEYYPYGMVIEELSYNLSKNRYGFGGTHEMDNEVKGGVGKHLSFGEFGYDTRVARRFNNDPIDQIFISNYAAFANNPINYTDPSGYSIVTDEDIYNKDISPDYEKHLGDKHPFYFELYSNSNIGEIKVKEFDRTIFNSKELEYIDREVERICSPEPTFISRISENEKFQYFHLEDKIAKSLNDRKAEATNNPIFDEYNNLLANFIFLGDKRDSYSHEGTHDWLYRTRKDLNTKSDVLILREHNYQSFKLDITLQLLELNKFTGLENFILNIFGFSTRSSTVYLRYHNPDYENNRYKLDTGIDLPKLQGAKVKIYDNP